jgi:hypothetical protein
MTKLKRQRGERYRGVHVPSNTWEVMTAIATPAERADCLLNARLYDLEPTTHWGGPGSRHFELPIS